MKLQNFEVNDIYKDKFGNKYRMNDKECYEIAYKGSVKGFEELSLMKCYLEMEYRKEKYMTDLFREYVTKVLKRNGIDENEEFETSDERYGTLKWEDGTMYDLTNRNRLEILNIVWILEESDLKRILKFDKITFVEALKLMKCKTHKISVELNDGTLYSVELEIVGSKMRSEILKIEYPHGTWENIYHYKTITSMLDEQFYKLV